MTQSLIGRHTKRFRNAIYWTIEEKRIHVETRGGSFIAVAWGWRRAAAAKLGRDRRGACACGKEEREQRPGGCWRRRRRTSRERDGRQNPGTGDGRVRGGGEDGR